MATRILAALAVLAMSATVSLAAPRLDPLVSADWLAANTGRDDIVVLDIRSASEGPADAVYLKGHVPGAVAASYPGAWRATRDGLPAQMPEVSKLQSYLAAIGVNDSKGIVIVPNGSNSSDFSAAARVYRTLKELGLPEVAILDGGMRAWTTEGKPVETNNVQPTPVDFKADPNPALLTSTEQVAADIGTSTILLDARPASFFVGEKKHRLAPRPGRLPGAIGLYQGTFFDDATGKLKPKAELALIAAATLGDKNTPIVSYCNTGHWASANWFVLHEVLGYHDVSLYDASMVGWTLDPNRPVETGDKQG